MTNIEQQRIEARIIAAGWTWEERIESRRWHGREAGHDYRAWVRVRGERDELLRDVTDKPDAREAWIEIAAWMDDRSWRLESIRISDPTPLAIGGRRLLVIRAALSRRINGAMMIHNEERRVVIPDDQWPPTSISRPGVAAPLVMLGGGCTSWSPGWCGMAAERIDGRLLIRVGDRDPIALEPTGDPIPLDRP